MNPGVSVVSFTFSSNKLAFCIRQMPFLHSDWLLPGSCTGSLQKNKDKTNTTKTNKQAGEQWQHGGSSVLPHCMFIHVISFHKIMISVAQGVQNTHKATHSGLYKVLVKLYSLCWKSRHMLAECHHILWSSNGTCRPF